MSRALAGARVLVLGLGRFSGGVETARFLRAQGADVLVSDQDTRERLAAPAAEVEALGARLAFGPQTEALLTGRDLVVANPAVPFEHPVLRAARERGVPVTTEINLFLERVRARVLGVTGTKGKSTTSALLARMLAGTGRRVHLGGNVGRALVAQVDAIGADDLVVLELSSFQLWWFQQAPRAVSVALITNLFPDHLDRHLTMEAYAAAKRLLFEGQGPSDAAVLPADDPTVALHGFLSAGRGRRVTFGEGGTYRLEGTRLAGPGAPDDADLSTMRLWGAHNRRNALAAAAAALQVPGVTWAHVLAGAREQTPLPHRLAPVGEVGGVLYVDDSNATTPQSAIEALAAVPRPAVVLAGGKPKGVDVTPLVEALARRARAVVTLGTSGPALEAALRGRVRVEPGGPDLASAVRTAAALARPGDVVLLSPGFSSLDQHVSFAERGDRFAEAVRALSRAP